MFSGSLIKGTHISKFGHNTFHIASKLLQLRERISSRGFGLNISKSTFARSFEQSHLIDDVHFSSAKVSFVLFAILAGLLLRTVKSFSNSAKVLRYELSKS